MRIFVMLALLCGVFLTACKDKKQPLTEQKVEVVEEKKVEVVKPEEPKPVKKAMNYFLVAGCFEVYSNAEKLHKQLLSEGYESTIIPFYHLTMVTYRGFETRVEAQVALNQMVTKKGKESTWVYPEK